MPIQKEATLRSRTMTEFSPLFGWASTEVTEQVISSKLIMPLALALF